MSAYSASKFAVRGLTQSSGQYAHCWMTSYHSLLRSNSTGTSDTQDHGKRLRPRIRADTHAFVTNILLSWLLFLCTFLTVAHPDDDKYGGHGSVAKMVGLNLLSSRSVINIHKTQAAKLPPELEGAKPDVIAELVGYLVKPQAYFMTGISPFCLVKVERFSQVTLLTGQTLIIDGGMFFD